MFSLLILAIIMTLSIGQWTPFWTNQVVNFETKRIYHALQYAKSLAIKNNDFIAICGTIDFQQCSSDWSKGYMIFRVNKNNPVTQDEILRIEKKNFPFALHSKRRKKFTFQGDGQCLTRGSIYIGESPYQKRLIISDSGRVRVENVA